jgi:signal transduction histidine kinase
MLVPGEEDVALLETRAVGEMTLLAVPLLSQGRLHGVALAARRATFDPDELATALSLCGFAACALDNVERYAAARAEREQLAAVFASASDGMALVNGARTIVQANAAFAGLLGQELGELVGRSCCEALRRVGADRCSLCEGECLLARTLEMGEAIPHHECQFLLPRTGRPAIHVSGPRTSNRYVDFSLTSLGGPGDRRVLLVGRDVTAARTMDEMKAHFLSMVSHELRGPLMAVNGYMDLVLSQEGFSDEQRSFLQRARVGSEHLTTLVEDLLLLSRRDAGQLKMNLHETDLTHVIRESVEEMEMLAESSEIALKLDAPRTLPLVRADKDRMKQVLRNLISNAIKFTLSGGTVYVSAEVAGGQLVLRVRDTGIGIPTEHLDHIFERFYQVEKSPMFGRFQGQGLGLAIVRIIIEGHGGEIHVESVPGTGSTFTVHLPIVPDDD